MPDDRIGERERGMSGSVIPNFLIQPPVSGRRLRKKRFPYDDQQQIEEPSPAARDKDVQFAAGDAAGHTITDEQRRQPEGQIRHPDPQGRQGDPLLIERLEQP